MKDSQMDSMRFILCAIENLDALVKQERVSARGAYKCSLFTTLVDAELGCHSSSLLKAVRENCDINTV